MKKILIFVVILLLILLASAGYFFLVKNKGIPAGPGASNTQEPPKKNAAADKITIPTSEGDVAINNIEKNPVKDIPFDGSVLFQQTENYDMYYYPPDNGFVITLMNSELEKARTGAENDFVEALGITKEQACQLKVTLNVLFSVSEKASGKNYGLSFCPNGKPLPEN